MIIYELRINPSRSIPEQRFNPQVNFSIMPVAKKMLTRYVTFMAQEVRSF